MSNENVAVFRVAVMSSTLTRLRSLLAWCISAHAGVRVVATFRRSLLLLFLQSCMVCKACWVELQHGRHETRWLMKSLTSMEDFCFVLPPPRPSPAQFSTITPSSIMMSGYYYVLVECRGLFFFLAFCENSACWF